MIPNPYRTAYDITEVQIKKDESDERSKVESAEENSLPVPCLPNPYLSPPQTQYPSSDNSTMDSMRSKKSMEINKTSDRSGQADETDRIHSPVSAPSSTSHRSKRPRTAKSTSSSRIINPYLTPPPTSKGTPKGKKTKKSKSTKKDLPAPASSSSSPKGGPTEYATLSPHGLQPFTTPINDHFIYLFFRFCSERHRMHDKREAGVPRGELSEDETMTKMFVGNVFRDLDRGSLRMKDEIMAEGDQSIEEVSFRVFLFCGFYLYSTWCALKEGLGHIPTYFTFDEEFPLYEKILHPKSFGRKETLYTSGFQIVPPTRYFGLNQLPHYAATLRFVKTLMEIKLPARLAACRYAVDASQTIQTIPTLGAFLSLNLLCYLNDSTHFKFFYRNFASCGPGSRSFLQRIFEKEAINSVATEEAGLVWLYENQWRYWARLGVDPPYATGVPGIRPGMRCLDFENALCWCHRYVADASKHSWSSFGDLPPPVYDSSITDLADFPAWCENEKDKGSSSSAMLEGDYDEGMEKLPAVKNGEGDLEEVYEVEKVICRLGSYTSRKKNGSFRVRWKGYPPEDDTWERESTLRDGAEEALQDWLDWEQLVWDTIERIKTDMPWTKPDIGDTDRVKEEKE